MDCPCGMYYPDREKSCPYCGRPREKKKTARGPRYSCPNCGALLPLNAGVCPNCGAEAKFIPGANLRGAKLAAKEIWEPEYRAAREEALVRRAKDREIVSVVLIATTEKKSAAGAVGRGLIGGVLLGPLGMVAGAITGKGKPGCAVFSVKYASGKVKTETVEIGSARFMELSAMLHE